MIMHIWNGFSNPNNRAFVLAMALILISACSQAPHPPETRIPGTTGSEGLVLMVGSGGGFSGQWTGLAVSDSGMVYTWQGFTPDSATFQPDFQLSPASMRILDSLMNEKWPIIHDPGNFSFLIRVRSGEPLIWHAGSPSDSTLSGWYESLNMLVDNNRQSIQ